MLLVVVSPNAARAPPLRHAKARTADAPNIVTGVSTKMPKRDRDISKARVDAHNIQPFAHSYILESLLPTQYLDLCLKPCNSN